MFNWLKRSKPAHPMADVKNARQLVAELSGHDPSTALDKISAWLDSINQPGDFNLQQRWELIDLLDKASIAHRRKLLLDQISARDSGKAHEYRLWKASFGFLKMLGAVYLQCIEDFTEGAAGAEAVRKDLALIAGRALRASSLQLKWTFLRFGKIDQRLWRELGSAYLFAESQGLAALRVDLYPDKDGPSSAQDELLKALMLAMASPNSLAPLKQHIAERIVAHFSSRFVLQGKPAPGCGFSFDLAAARPPARLQKEMGAGSTVRFFGAGESAQGLTDLMREVRATDGVPSDVYLGADFDQETVLSVLVHLDRYWNGTSPAPRAERGELVTGITVVPGLPNILRYLELVANGTPPDPKDFSDQESWITVNKSDGGYKASVPKDRKPFDCDPLTGARTATGDWLRIGSLMAVSEKNAATWRLGLVRRITQEGSGRRYVGIELLAGMVFVVKLAAASGPRSGQPEKRRSAVLLSSATGKSDEALVLMRAGHFVSTQSLTMQQEDKRYLLLPIELVEAGEDFDCARFRMYRNE
jgi:hypothetical protein